MNWKKVWASSVGLGMIVAACESGSPWEPTAQNVESLKLSSAISSSAVVSSAALSSATVSSAALSSSTGTALSSTTVSSAAAISSANTVSSSAISSVANSSSSLSTSSATVSSSSISSSSVSSSLTCSDYPTFKPNTAYDKIDASNTDCSYTTSNGCTVTYLNKVYKTWWAAAQPTPATSWTLVGSCQ